MPRADSGQIIVMPLLTVVPDRAPSTGVPAAAPAVHGAGGEGAGRANGSRHDGARVFGG